MTLRGPRAGERIEAEYPIKYDDLAQLKANAEVLRKLKAEHLELMRAARANGASLREISEAVGMSHTGVAKALSRRSARE